MKQPYFVSQHERQIEATTECVNELSRRVADLERSIANLERIIAQAGLLDSSDEIDIGIGTSGCDCSAGGTS